MRLFLTLIVILPLVVGSWGIWKKRWKTWAISWAIVTALYLVKAICWDQAVDWVVFGYYLAWTWFGYIDRRLINAQQHTIDAYRALVEIQSEELRLRRRSALYTDVQGRIAAKGEN